MVVRVKWLLRAAEVRPSTCTQGPETGRIGSLKNMCIIKMIYKVRSLPKFLANLLIKEPYLFSETFI